MKNLIILLFLVTLVQNFTFAKDLADVTININIPQDEQIEKQLEKVYPLVDKAKQTNNPEDYLQASIAAYKTNKKGDPLIIKNYNDMFSAMAIEYSLQRYNITKEEKYLNIAYKWCKQAIEDRTNQIYSIRAAMIMAGYKRNPEMITEAYDLYREKDINGAESFVAEYENLLNATKEYKTAQTQETKQKWSNGLRKTAGVLLYGVAAGAAGYANAYNNTYNNMPKTYNSTTTQVGNTIYTRTTSY